MEKNKLPGRNRNTPDILSKQKYNNQNISEKHSSNEETDVKFSDSGSEDENEKISEQSDDEETKEKKKQEALKKELFANLPPHCTAYIPTDINPKKRERKPTRETTAEECFVSCPKIVPRSEWGAEMPRKQAEQMMFRVRPAIFMETDATNCESAHECSKMLRSMQRMQMDLLQFDDIPYSFLISEDGMIFEGRGWGYENEKARGIAGIGYIGYHSFEPLEGPTDAMLQATYDLIMCGVSKGFLYNPFATGAFSGETPQELIMELMKHAEAVDYRAKPEDVGIDDDD